MSGNIQSFDLKSTNCQFQTLDEKQNQLQIVYCPSKMIDTTSDANQSGFQSESRFPSPPVLNKSILNISYNSGSDTSDSEKCNLTNKSFLKKKKLPPIGVFWDIENCQVPKGRSAVSVARLIRDLFFTGYREAEFVVVCDVKKESSQIIQELNDAQVTLIHVASTCKNAADEKLRQALRRFADTYSAPAAVILISGDINFAADLSDLKHRKKIHVILIHKENAADALILCASEHYNYTNITQNLPLKEAKPINGAMEVVVRNLPEGYDPLRLRNRLKQLSDNCGGRVVFVSLETGTAVVRFNNTDVAIRAQRRMDGEDVYGNKISVSYPNSVRNWEKSYSPYKIPARKISKNPENFAHQSLYGMPPPPLPYTYLPPSAPPLSTSGNVSKNTQDYLFHPLDQFQLNQHQFQKPNTQPQNQNSYYEVPRSIRGAHGDPMSVLSDFTNVDPWRPHSASFTEGQKRSFTPSENSAIANQSWRRNISASFTALNTMDYENCENRAQSINFSLRNNTLINNSNSSSPVELLVTNLDHNINPQELKSILLSMFQEYAMVVGLSLFHQSDGNLTANVRVSSLQDAQYIISKLHRSKIGHKRIVISYAQTAATNPNVLRSQVVALLQKVPGNKMPLFKFRELLETRYKISVSVSELYKMKDVCSISEELGGRMISLCLDLRTIPSPHLLLHSGVESPHCMFHCPNGGLRERGWAEPDSPPLPNVRIKLEVFSRKVHELLQSHHGILPLTSFPVCYELQIGEKLPVDKSGVSLEHLITCVKGVDLRLSKDMVKYLVYGNQRDDARNDDDNSNGSVAGMKCVSPLLATQLALFSRELVDLLKTAPHCQLPFSRFIPAYHHHFGRQCRVADYGYTRLADLFEALTHVVQIIDDGNRRLITLTHSAQMRRFTSDLLRVLKVQAAKQLALSDFTAAYERVLARPFDPVDYGLCELTDLLNEVSENTVAIQQIENEIIIAVPKKEQTPEEILKTKQFAIEVIDLLRHAPQYGMLFIKFVPAYHHHFGHQCRVYDYGFSKLIELFEAIPDIVKIENTPDGERKVSLTPHEAFKVVEQQLISLVNSSKLQSIPLVALPATFLREYGYPLQPELYDCLSIDDLIRKLSNSIQLIAGPAGPQIVVSEESSEQQLQTRIWSLLLKPPYSATLSNLIANFKKKFNYSFSSHQLEKYRSVFQVNHRNNDIEICLKAKYVLAARLYNLLFENGGTLLLDNVEGMYLRKFGNVLRPADYDAISLNTLLSQLSFLVVLRGRRNKRNVSLNPTISGAGVPLPTNMKYANGEYIQSGNDVDWPPPAAHTYLFSSERTTASSPPKPDTPPSINNSCWGNSIWTSSSNFHPSLNLRIPLPCVQTPPLLDNPYSLISPMKNLLPAFPDDRQQIQAPDPSELPMPNAELLNKSKTASPSKDSGISSASFSNLIDEPDSSTNFESENIASPKKKRHLRLAAHFTTPLNLT